MAGSHLPHTIETWTVQVPRLSLEYEPLLSAIMALSSHHLARQAETLERASHYMTLRLSYLQSTIQAHQPSLTGVTRENADAVCFTSLILSVDTVASMQDRPLEPYEPPLQWLKLSRSISGVWKVAVELLKGDPDAKIRSTLDSILPLYQEAKTVSSERLAHLLEPHDGEILNPIDAEAYEETARVICWILSGVESGEHLMMFSRRLRMLPLLLCEHFIALLECRDPRSLVLLAHYFAAVSYAGELWWIGDTSRRELWAIENFLDESWQGMLAWPINIIQQKDKGKDKGKDKDRRDHAVASRGWVAEP